MSRKPEPEELDAPIAADMEDVEPLRRKARDPEADDTGRRNPSVQQDQLAEAQRLFGLKSENGEEDLVPQDPLQDPAPEADPALAEGDDWDDDWEEEDWGEEWADDDEDDEARASEEKEHLVNEIREAMGAMSHIAPEERRDTSTPPPKRDPYEKNWAEDEEFGRKALARNQLGAGASEDRLLEEAEDKFEDDEGTRRRSAMAHLKAAAKATKADRILSNNVGRNPATDPEEQSAYRADLAKVVKPRPVTRPTLEDDEFEPEQTLEAIAETQDENATAWMDAEIDFDAPQDGETSKDAQDAEGQDDWMLPDREGDEPEQSSGMDADSDEENEARRTRLLMNADQENLRSAIQSDPRLEIQPARKIWDIADDGDDENEHPASITDDAAMPPSDAPAPRDFPRAGPRGLSALSPQLDPLTQPMPTAGGGATEPVAGLGKMPANPSRSGRGAGRVKTRLLGFQGDQSNDIFAAAQASASEAGEPAMFPVGWIVVVDGPGRGASFTLFDGVSQIGRGDDQAIKLDFGDTAISRQNHAAVAFDHEQSKFFLGHGGKSNLVRLNDRPVLSTEELSDGDRVRIGETTLLFVALCNDDFGWSKPEGDGADHAALA